MASSINLHFTLFYEIHVNNENYDTVFHRHTNIYNQTVVSDGQCRSTKHEPECYKNLYQQKSKLLIWSQFRWKWHSSTDSIYAKFWNRNADRKIYTLPLLTDKNCWRLNSCWYSISSSHLTESRKFYLNSRLFYLIEKFPLPGQLLSVQTEIIMKSNKLKKINSNETDYNFTTEKFSLMALSSKTRVNDWTIQSLTSHHKFTANCQRPFCLCVDLIWLSCVVTHNWSCLWLSLTIGKSYFSIEYCLK